MSYGKKYEYVRLSKCYYNNVGVSSETSHVSLCGRTQRDAHSVLSRLLGIPGERLFLSLPIDSFSGYFKKLTDYTQRGLTVLFCGGLMIHRLDLDDALKVEYTKFYQDIAAPGLLQTPSLAYPGKEVKAPPCLEN